MAADASARTQSAIGDAVAEVTTLAADFARAVSTGMGLRSA
jgi:hypothetical protein